MEDVERDHGALYEIFIKNSKKKESINFEDYLQDLAQCRSAEQLSLIINKTIGMDKKTLLYIAAEKNLIQEAEILVRYGAKFDIQLESGDTPLHIACFKSHSNMVKKLLEFKHGEGTVCYQENPDDCMCRYKALEMKNNKMRFPKDLATIENDKFFLHETEILYWAGRGLNMQELSKLIGNAKENVDVPEGFYDKLLDVCIRINYVDLIGLIVLNLSKGVKDLNLRIKRFVITALEAHRRDARMSKDPFYFLLMCYEMLGNNVVFVKGQHFDGISLKELRMTNDDFEEFRNFLTSEMKSLVLAVTRSCCNDSTKKALLVQLHNKGTTDWSGLGFKKINDDWLQEIKEINKWLKLEKNKLVEVPKISDHIVLTKLEIQDNNIRKVPSSLFSLKLLRVLDLSHNHISMLPEDIKFSVVLHELYLSHNKLTKLPKSMKDSHIAHLDLAYNDFGNLPLCVCYMPMLTTLVLNGNAGILKFPHQIGKMRRDIELRLTDMEQLHYSYPSSLLKAPNADEANQIVLYHRQKLYPTNRNKTMNLMVVGQRGSGKSLLVQRLLGNYDNVYEPDHTIGINVDYNLLPLKSLLGSRFHMKIFDFAGEIEYSTNQCFFTNCSLYLLVWNVREKMSELEEWLNCLATLVPNAHLMIAGTHAEELIEKEHRLKLHRDLAEWLKSIPRFRNFTLGLRKNSENYFGKYWFTIVSNAVTGRAKINAVKNLKKGIDQVSKYLKNPNSGQKVLGERLPRFYFRLAEEVQSRSGREKIMTDEAMLFLMKEVYAKAKSSICQWRRADEETTPSIDLRDLTAVLQYMHETGIILHFKSNANLHQICFTDVKTLRDKLLRLSRPSLGAKNDGKLTIYELQESVGREYAQLGLEYLLQMFHIGFKVSPGIIQLTHSMSETRPQVNQVLSMSDPVEYHRLHVFDYIPFGFWVRLISRIIRYLDRYLLGAEDLAYYERPVHTDFQKIVSDNVYYWKYGFIYNDESNQIYVEISQLDKDKTAEWSSRFCRCPEINGKKVIHSNVTAAGSDVAPRLISSIVDDIRTLIEEWHKPLANLNADNRSGVRQYSPCCSCMNAENRQPHLFELDESLEGFLNGTCVLKCPAHIYNNLIPIKLLFPEFVFYGRPRLTLKSCHTLIYDKMQDAPYGGFGTVYKGKLISHEKCGFQQSEYDVAVKKLKFEVGDLGFVGKFYEFRKEVLMLNHVSVHPNIISFYGIHVGKELEIVMEYAPYGPLADILIGNLPRLLIYRVSFQIADALSYFHSWGILHRDLKPSNIVLFSKDPSKEINIKIIDFGTANYMSTTGMGQKAGSQRYYAPEVSLEKSGYTEAVDIWCYSLVLYEMLTGWKPFNGVDEKDIQIRLKHLERPQFDENAKVYKCLRALTGKCWENAPSKRPSAKQILSILCCSSFQLLKSVFQLPKSTKDLKIRPNFVSDKLSFISDSSLMCLDSNDLSVKKIIEVGKLFHNVDLFLDYLYVDEDHIAFVGRVKDKEEFEVLFIKFSEGQFSRDADDQENLIEPDNDMLKIMGWFTYTGRFHKMFCNHRSMFLFYQYAKRDTTGVMVEYYFENDKFQHCTEKKLYDCLDISMKGNALVMLCPSVLKFYKTLQPGLSEPKIVQIDDVYNMFQDKDLMVINHNGTWLTTVMTYVEEPRSLKLFKRTFNVSSSYQREVITALVRVPSTKMFWLGTDGGRIHICKLLPKSVRILKSIYPYLSPVQCFVLRQQKDGETSCVSYSQKLNKGAQPCLLEFSREFLLEKKVSNMQDDASDLLLLWHVPREENLQLYPNRKKISTSTGLEQMDAVDVFDEEIFKTETEIIKDLTFDCPNHKTDSIN